MTMIWKSLKPGKQSQPQVGGSFLRQLEKAAQDVSETRDVLLLVVIRHVNDTDRYILKIAEWENTNIKDGVNNNNEGCQN